MNILDENIPADQRHILENWRISVKQIGFNIGRQGLKDDEIIPFLQQQRRPTFFTRDYDFYYRPFCHARYCLVCLDVEKNEVAFFVRKVLSHPNFETQAQRMGKVIWVSSTGVSFWELYGQSELSLEWK